MALQTHDSWGLPNVGLCRTMFNGVCTVVAINLYYCKSSELSEWVSKD